MSTVVVTGDSGSLGSGICHALGKETDVHIVGLSRRETDAVSELKDALGERYIHIPFDLSDPREVEKRFRTEVYGEYDIVGLVNNSAMAYDDLITNMNVDPLERMFRINVYSPMVLTKLVIRNMLLHELGGSIVHISSVSVHTGYKGLGMYAATKGALEAFSKNTAREWGPRGVRSNCIAAGFMDTSMTASLTEDQRERIFKRNSKKRALETAEVARVAAFLMSQESSGITGAVLPVDNGTI